MVEIVGHSQTKGRDNGEPKLRPKPARQSSTLPMAASVHIASVSAVQRNVWSWGKTRSNRTTVKMALMTQAVCTRPGPRADIEIRVIVGFVLITFWDILRGSGTDWCHEA